MSLRSGMKRATSFYFSFHTGAVQDEKFILLSIAHCSFTVEVKFFTMENDNAMMRDFFASDSDEEFVPGNRMFDESVDIPAMKILQ